jgi:hypothetical protein
LGSIESDRNEKDTKQKSFLTDKQKRAVKKVMNDTKNDLKKMVIQDIDRTFTQTAVKEVIASIEEQAPRSKKKGKKKRTSS